MSIITQQEAFGSYYSRGMSLHRYFAGQALAGICANPHFFGSTMQGHPQAAAQFALDAADAMASLLTERAKATQ